MDESRSNEPTGNKHGGSRNNMLKLLDLVQELSVEPGNQWFASEIKSRFTKAIPSGNSLQLVEVYEEYAKKIYTIRAETFYKEFKILEIKKQLIEDYIRMETFRSNGNFEDFCLAAFQQIELITNTLAESLALNAFINKNVNGPSTTYINKSSGGQINPQYNSKTLGELIFKKEDISSNMKKAIPDWTFIYKHKAVLYYFYFNKELSSSSLFFRLYTVGNELYQSRNLNHRGGNQYDWQQSIIEKVLANQDYYFLIFEGYVGDFVMTINKNL